MNQMLAGVDWMSTIKPDDDDYVAAHIDWLKSASPEDWHRVALDFNWTNRLEPLLWIVMQDECELATALEVFWRCEPGWDLMLMAMGETLHARDEADIIACIAQRLHEGSYTRRTIAFDPEAGIAGDYAEMEDHWAQIAEPPFRPHPDMDAKVPGYVVTNDPAFYARYPVVFHGTVFVELPASPKGTEGAAPVRVRPREEVASPDQEAARSELTTILFNLSVMGGLIAALPIVQFPASREWIAWPLVAIGFGLSGHTILTSTATLRGLLRDARREPSQLVGALIGACTLIAGIMAVWAGLQGAWLIEPSLGVGQAATIAKLAFCVLMLGIFWVLSARAARYLTRRVLFR